ncbi:hypothetical protein StoSoilB20_30070 [Arthrobacter sp. StoSoilB20]|nr:hypothetical protein StoSoilB20_30070 [Arthrobacter sp. StoSoilB20]
MAIPDVVIQVRRINGEHRVVDHGRPAEATVQLCDGHPRGNSRGQAKDHVVEAARAEPFRRRNNIKPDGAAEATVLQHRGFALEEASVPIDASEDKGTVKEIVEDHHGVLVGPAKPDGGGLTALAVQGTDDCEVHGSSVLLIVLISK